MREHCKSCGAILRQDGTCSRCLNRLNKQEKIVSLDISNCHLTIAVKDEEEEQLVKDMSADYQEIDFEVPDAAAQLEILLTLRLDTKRIQKLLSKQKIDLNERKLLTEQLNKNAVAIEKTQTTIGITKDKLREALSSPAQIFADLAEQLHQWTIENKHIFTGIAKCAKCNDIIIFQGELPTFEQAFLKELEIIVNSLKKDNNYSADNLVEKIKQLFQNKQNLDIYKETARKYIEQRFT